MSHPHKAMLDEFHFAMRHFVPTIPQEIKDEAQKAYEELLQNENLDEDFIKKVFYEIGLKEYPYRKAYEELTHSNAEAQMKKMVLDHVDETVRAVIKPHLEAGVSLEELVSSDLFTEQLDPKQRYQVEDGILVAKDKLAESLKKQVGDQVQTYNEFVQKWKAYAQDMVKAIDELERFAQGGDENQQAEIKGKATRFREGFLVTEIDPELETIKKEIEYWQDLFSGE